MREGKPVAIVMATKYIDLQIDWWLYMITFVWQSVLHHVSFCNLLSLLSMHFDFSLECYSHH